VKGHKTAYIEPQKEIKADKMKKLLTAVLLLCALNAGASVELKIVMEGSRYIPVFTENGQALLAPPSEGLWSIALDWTNDWPARWVHAQAVTTETSGDWTIFHGSIDLPDGKMVFRDALRKENGRIRIIRRYEWKGSRELKYVTLSARWQTPVYSASVVMPGILYFGNPSGYRNGGNMPSFGKENAPEAYFEEHRFPMPFVSVEIEKEGVIYNAAVHTLPSEVPYGNIPDQWWSLGATALEGSTEIGILSGPVVWNRMRSYAKARQRVKDALRYGDTYLNIKPGAVIEKEFFIETSVAERRGSAFISSVETSLDIFKPFYYDDMPAFRQIISDKYRFAVSRYIENEKAAGFSMYPLEMGPKYVFGWCGQAASCGYALQPLKNIINDPSSDMMVQKSLDHLCTSPFNENGFHLRYNLHNDEWEWQEPLSQGQGMQNVAMAIEAAKKNRRFDTSKWEEFFRKACDIHSERILRESWKPVSTNEGFMAAPLAAGYRFYKKQQYLDAARKIADHYIERHLSMDEPYWGGTLDATGEDKEGAWAGFQAFLTMYELTKEPGYLKAAEHAAYVTLTYTVVWDIPFDGSRMGDHYFKTRGWTMVSPQNQHLDVFGVFFTPAIYKMGAYLGKDHLRKLAVLMFRTCGQIIDPYGSQGEQIQHTNFGQAGDMSNIYTMRGGYSEHWTVFWITAHFLNAAARFMDIDPSIVTGETLGRKKK